MTDKIKTDFFMLIRISEDDFIDSLQKKGHLYCNTIKYFRRIEDNGVKGDKNEGKAYLKQAKNLTIMIDDKIVGKSDNAQIYYENKNDIGNIYCLYGVKTSLVNFKKKTLQRILIENEVKDFGKSALLIINPEEFLKRINKALVKESKEFNFHPVNYYDHRTYEGELSPFYKSDKYKYQNEVRLWIPYEKEEPYEFLIGDISDISYKIPVRDLDKISVEVL